MRTAQEQELINKIAHNARRLTLTREEIRAITSEMLNSKIGGGSDMSDCSVAFALARSQDGLSILEANKHALALQISAETLCAVTDRGHHAGQSVAYLLAGFPAGRAILAKISYALGLYINVKELQEQRQLINKLAHNINAVTPGEIQAITPDILNGKINDGSDKAECSVAFALALSTEGRLILAANGCELALQINAQTLNAVIQQGEYAGESVALLLARHSEGREILAAKDYELALHINVETLNAARQYGLLTGQSVASALMADDQGREILAAIRGRHKNNKLMFALYSSRTGRLGNREELDSVLNMLDGRTPQKLSLK